MVNAVRTENPVLETIDYVETRGKKGNACPFQTCPALERGRVVYQVGTGDATNALRAAQVRERSAMYLAVCRLPSLGVRWKYCPCELAPAIDRHAFFVWMFRFVEFPPGLVSD